MSEEKKEIKSFEEDEKNESEEKDESNEDKSKESEEKKSEEEESKKGDFEKNSESVSAGKYNQAIRKQRELDVEKRELERKLAEASSNKAEKKEKEEEEDDDDFFGDEKEKKKESPDTSKIIDEKLKPVLDSIKKREDNDRKNARTAFFDTHPEYLDANKWQELLDEMDNSLNPNSKDDYYTQLEKTHRILAGDTTNAEIEDKKAEMASDSSGGGAEKASIKEEFNAEDRKIMKDMDISEEGMRAFKKQIAEGKTSIL